MDFHVAFYILKIRKISLMIFLLWLLSLTNGNFSFNPFIHVLTISLVLYLFYLFFICFLIFLSQVAQQYRGDTARYHPMLMSIGNYSFRYRPLSLCYRGSVTDKKKYVVCCEKTYDFIRLKQAKLK